MPSGDVGRLTLEIASKPPWKLSARGMGLEGHEFIGSDLFDALIALREKLEREGCLPLCAGARVDVFPSGMSRSMGGGRTAYVTIPGRPGTQTIDIFADAEPDAVSTISAQANFHRRWIKSISQLRAEPLTPTKEEIEEAKRVPNGHVYRIAGHFDAHEDVPPEAIIGAWKVDSGGRITGGFIPNGRYNPRQWP